MSIGNSTMIGAALLTLGASVATAGSPEPAPATAAPIAPAPAITDWSGPFLGLRAGAGSADAGFRFLGNNNGADHSLSGGFGGIYGGYDFQSGANVYGVDLAYNFSGINGSTACPNPSFRCESEIESFGALRGRFGRAFNDVLIYGAAGYAFGEAYADAVHPVTGPYYADNSASVDGWTVALGAQKMLNAGWALRGEVAYYDLGAKSGAFKEGGGGDPVTYDLDMTTVSVGIEKRW